MPKRRITVDQFSFTVNAPLEVCLARLESGINFRRRLGWRHRFIKQSVSFQEVDYYNRYRFEINISASYETFVDGDLRRDGLSSTSVTGSIQNSPWANCIGGGSVLFFLVFFAAALVVTIQQNDFGGLAFMALVGVWFVAMVYSGYRQSGKGNRSVIVLSIRDTLEDAD